MRHPGVRRGNLVCFGLPVYHVLPRGDSCWLIQRVLLFHSGRWRRPWWSPGSAPSASFAHSPADEETILRESLLLLSTLPPTPPQGTKLLLAWGRESCNILPVLMLEFSFHGEERIPVFLWGTGRKTNWCLSIPAPSLSSPSLDPTVKETSSLEAHRLWF